MIMVALLLCALEKPPPVDKNVPETGRAAPSVFQDVPSWREPRHREDEALAYLAALDVYDKSVPWLTYDYVAAELQDDGSRKLLAIGHMASDDQGRWLEETQSPLQIENGQVWWYDRSHACDGYVCRAQTRDPDSSYIGQIEISSARVIYPTLDFCLGRTVSFQRIELLSDLMRANVDGISLVRVDPATGIARLAATVRTGAYLATVVVDVDPRHRYAPIRIASYDAYQGRATELIEVLDFRECAGVPIASHAHRTVFFTPVEANDPVATSRLSEVWIRDRLVKPATPEDLVDNRLRYWSAVYEAYGPRGFTAAALAPTQEYRLLHAEPLPGDTEFLDRLFAPEVRRDGSFVDQFRMLGTHDQPLETP